MQLKVHLCSKNALGFEVFHKYFSGLTDALLPYSTAVKGLFIPSVSIDTRINTLKSGENPYEI